MPNELKNEKNKFAEQCTVHEYKDNVLKSVYKDMACQIGLNTYSSRKTIQGPEVDEQFLLWLSETNTKGVGVSSDKVI